MCSIFGSTVPSVLCEAYNVNSYRGKFSYSITAVKFRNTMEYYTEKAFGELTDQMIYEFCVRNPSDYYICHSQAPTNSIVKTPSRIHPIRNGDELLLHNGIITQKYCDILSEEYFMDNTFDTSLLLRHIEGRQYDNLDDVQGSFACVHMTPDGMFFFRNANSILHFNGKDVSSAKRVNHEQFVPNQIYQLTPSGFNVVGQFNNKFNNYYVA